MVRVVRSRSRTPTRVSNRPIARPTPDDVRPSASAARAIDPASTTAIRTVTPERRRASYGMAITDSQSEVYGHFGPTIKEKAVTSSLRRWAIGSIPQKRKGAVKPCARRIGGIRPLVGVAHDHGVDSSDLRRLARAGSGYGGRMAQA